MATLKLLTYLIPISFIFCCPNLSPTQQNIISDPQVIPQNIKIGTFFNGLKVSITAQIPKHSGVIVKLVGKDQNLKLNEKGKKGIIWLNVNQVDVKNAPSIYILTSTDRVNELCSDSLQAKEMLGYNSLKNKIIFDSKLPLNGIEFEEFIKFKEKTGCYSIDKNAKVIPDTDGKYTLKATINIPSSISPDNYDVVIYCFDKGYLLDKVVVKLSVEEVGLPLVIRNLAKQSPAIYGIVAIIIAMIAGSIIGLVFTKKRNK